MERPALQKLLEDIKARKIDVVVVYKASRALSTILMPDWTSAGSPLN